MATGDFTLFEEFADTFGQGDHHLDADVLKLALIDNVVTPTAADATPAWAAGSGVDYDGNEVATTGGYTANGETLTYAGLTRWAEVGGTATLNAEDVSLAQNALGFTNAYWAILYNDTHASKAAIGFIELGGPVSEVAGPITISWNASGILTVAVS